MLLRKSLSSARAFSSMKTSALRVTRIVQLSRTSSFLKSSEAKWRTSASVRMIFCFPSITRNEAFGIALAEAMYCGKPAVTFTIEGSGVNFVSLDGVMEAA